MLTKYQSMQCCWTMTDKQETVRHCTSVTTCWRRHCQLPASSEHL